jgi:glutaminyl-peptide cyclotransferase
VALLTACSPPPPTIPGVRPQVLATLPHDPTSFTEGLQRDGTTLWEGTGLAGESKLRELDPTTGAVRRSAPLPGKLWGEGIAVTADTIWQLTYQDGVALQWDKATLKVKKQVALTGEGWGLCYDGNRLVQSDGSATLRFRNPSTFAQTGALTVTLDGTPLPQLNELECAGGQVWANVWPSTQIVRINPSSGRVTATVDGAGLLTPEQKEGTDAMNGITWLGGDEYLVTGKWWPVMLRVRIVVPDG